MQQKPYILFAVAGSIGMIMGAMIGWSYSLHRTIEIAGDTLGANPKETLDGLAMIGIQLTIAGTAAGTVLGLLVGAAVYIKSRGKRTGSGSGPE